MRAQPPAVQYSVLTELRTTRLEIAAQEAALLEAFKSLPLSPENRDQRATLLNSINALEKRDFFLLQATQAQITDMGSSGLINPYNQRETHEGFGDALGLAKLSGNLCRQNSLYSRTPNDSERQVGIRCAYQRLAKSIWLVEWR